MQKKQKIKTAKVWLNFRSPPDT